jgi:hypothetical protein
MAAELRMKFVMPSPEKLERTVRVFVLIPLVAVRLFVLIVGV